MKIRIYLQLNIKDKKKLIGIKVIVIRLVIFFNLLVNN